MDNLKNTDIVIVGTGVAGLFAALNLPEEKKIIMLTKSDVESSDSFLAQGGICMLRNDNDYDSYYEDTMRAGHYENEPRSVEIMIRSSQAVISELIGLGVDFERNDGEFLFTKEGAHRTPRILYHQDITGREITSKLLAAVRKKRNITINEYTEMIDIIESNGEARGVIAKSKDGVIYPIIADYTILATGGVGGIFEHSTNFRHLTGDAIAIGIRHKIAMRDLDYIQIHPTTLYSPRPGRRFLISESVRGEGAVLLDKNGERFTDELQPRDVVSDAIYEQMEKDGTPYVHLSLVPIGEAEIRSHFPHIYKRCLEEGYDVTREPVPVVPAQHYFMGGIRVGEYSQTSMPRLYAAGETACNGVHGANRLASNSLLESLVFAQRAARDITCNYKPGGEVSLPSEVTEYDREEDKNMILDEMERMRTNRE